MLDCFLVFPDWYVSILVDQLGMRRRVALLKAAYRRSKRLIRAVIDNALEDVGAVDKVDRVVMELGEQVIQNPDSLCLDTMFQVYRTLSYQLRDTGELLRILGNRQQTTAAAATRRSREQSAASRPRRSVSRVKSYTSIKTVPRMKTTKQSQQVTRFQHT